MARPAGLPCPECEGMLSRVLGAQGLLHACGTSLTVVETREDPEHPLAPCVWRIRRCPEDDVTLATVQFLAPLEGPSGQLAPGGRDHQCLDCGAIFSSLERQVDADEARDRLAHLARERVMLARAGRRDPWAPVRALPPTVAWHLEGR